MQTKLTLDDDVFHAVRQRAQRERISMGEAVSRYVRKALQSGEAPDSGVRTGNKYSVLPARGEVITTAHVRCLMEQAGI